MEEIIEENFKDILKSRHPKLFGLDKDDKFAKLHLKINVGKGYFYLLDTLYDLFDENNITIADIKKQYSVFSFSFFEREDLDALMKRARGLQYGICEMCGKKIEVSEFQKEEKKMFHKDYARCETCAINPKKEFPMSEDHITKDEIRKYLTDENYFYTNVRDFKEMIKNNTYDSKIINMKGVGVNTGEKHVLFKDETGSVVIGKNLNPILFDAEQFNLMSVFPVYKDGNIYINYKSA
jgi:hypothetical protein